MNRLHILVANANPSLPQVTKGVDTATVWVFIKQCSHTHTHANYLPNRL